MRSSDLTRSRDAIAWRGPVLALALVAGSCAGSGVGLDDAGVDGGPIAVDGGHPDGKLVAANFQTFQEQIFTPICTHCHAGASAPEQLQLDAANAYALLVNVASVELPSMKRVVPGDPDHSYLLVKLVPSDPRRVKDRMPRNGPPYLAPPEIAAIRTWIAQGAKP